MADIRLLSRRRVASSAGSGVSPAAAAAASCEPIEVVDAAECEREGASSKARASSDAVEEKDIAWMEVQTFRLDERRAQGDVPAASGGEKCGGQRVVGSGK